MSATIDTPSPLVYTLPNPIANPSIHPAPWRGQYPPPAQRRHSRHMHKLGRYVTYSMGNFANTIAYQVFGNRIQFYYVNVLKKL